MNRFALAVLVAGVSWGGPATAGDDAQGVSVAVSRSMYVGGDAVEIKVTNGRKDPIYLSGCPTFRLERFVGEKHQPVSSDRCVAEGDTKVVPPGEHVLRWTANSQFSGEILRVAVTFGWGCESGRALSQSRCKDFATAWSPNFRIGKGTEGS